LGKARCRDGKWTNDSEVLELLKNDVWMTTLKELADSDMNLASKMRRKMEKLLKLKA